MMQEYFPVKMNLTPISPKAADFTRLYQNWFNIIGAGVADVRIPNLDEPVCSQEDGDKFALRLENFFKSHLYERWEYDKDGNVVPREGDETSPINSYFKNKKVDTPPGFDRLCGTPAAIAMWQDSQRLKRKWGIK